MSKIIELLQKHKGDIEAELVRYYSMLRKSGVANQGDIEIKIEILESQLVDTNSKIGNYLREQQPKDELPGFTPDSKFVKKIRLFLGSSLELRNERDLMEIFINRENKRKIDQGIFFHLERWEDFQAWMSPTRLQNEYNDAVRQCDVFIGLFHNKAGQYTNEELRTATEQFIKTGTKPLILTYFKLPADKPEPSLQKLKDHLDSLGHFFSTFESTQDLLFHLKNQFEKMGFNYG